MIRSIYCLLLAIPLIVLAQQAWYEGGTLHHATVKDWRNATDHNRLATSADLFVTFAKAIESKDLDVPSALYLTIAKLYAQGLRDCIHEIAKGPKISATEKIMSLAKICYVIGMKSTK